MGWGPNGLSNLGYATLAFLLFAGAMVVCRLCFGPCGNCGIEIS
jgi:hypothetical protein